MTQQTSLKVDRLRYQEYYDLQEKLDALYVESCNGHIFTNLVDLILDEKNILMAYRNLKKNDGSKTPGTDKLTIDDIAILTADEVIERVRFYINKPTGYTPKAVRRKEIPKPNGTTRPLGIPCIWDRLIQQCIKQVLEPIVEAKFCEQSYGFRPNRSAENAIAACYKHIQRSNLHFVCEFDIKGFFDNVNHSKLIKQMWSLGIRDKKLIYIIKQILKAEIEMPDGSRIKPIKGTPQGGIISPILANIVLNELDNWVNSQWQTHPVLKKYERVHKGQLDYSNGWTSMKNRTNLKEMRLVRYADDFRIFCSNREDAQKVLYATTAWLKERLRLDVSEEKTRVVNLRKQYSEFLGFKMKVRQKGTKWVVASSMCDKALARACDSLIEQIKLIQKPPAGKTKYIELRKYNQMVSGIHEYYEIATDISLDAMVMFRRVGRVLYVRLREGRAKPFKKHGRALSPYEMKRYGKSQQIVYLSAGLDKPEPIYPIGFVSTRFPMMHKKDVNAFTSEGRRVIHKDLYFPNAYLLKRMSTQKLYNRSVEYFDNRLSLFSAQLGKCAITGKMFASVDDIHCHHIVPRNKGGTDKYQNLVLVLEPIHKLLHATKMETIDEHLRIFDLDRLQVSKLNKLRKEIGLFEI